MGFWTITIAGHGTHDNGLETDADRMAAVFVGELREAGHEVVDARFVLALPNGKNLLPFVPPVKSVSVP